MTPAMPILSRNNNNNRRGDDEARAKTFATVPPSDIDDARLLRRLNTEPPRLRLRRPPANLILSSSNSLFPTYFGTDEGYAADCDAPYSGGGGGSSAIELEEESPPTSCLSDSFAPRRRPSASSSPADLVSARRRMHVVSYHSSPKSSGIFPSVPRRGRGSDKRRREEKEEFERERAESYAALGTIQLDNASFNLARTWQANKRAKMEEFGNRDGNRNATFPTYVHVPQRRQQQEEKTSLDLLPRTPTGPRRCNHRSHLHQPRVVSSAAFPAVGAAAYSPTGSSVEAGASSTQQICGTRFIPGFGFVFGGSSLAMQVDRERRQQQHHRVMSASEVPALSTGVAPHRSTSGGMQAQTAAGCFESQQQGKDLIKDWGELQQSAIAFLRERLGQQRESRQATILAPPGA